MPKPDNAPSSPEPGKLSRRQFSRLAAGSAATLVTALANPNDAQAGPLQTAPEKSPMPAAPDPRLAQLERERAAPFTPEQRKRLPAELKNLDEGLADLRKFPLADGGSEPATVFTPVRAHANKKPA